MLRMLWLLWWSWWVLSGAAHAAEVRVGLALPFSGERAAEAELVRAAVERHADALYDAGELGEHWLSVVTADSAGDAASELASAGVVATIGFLDDERAAAAAPAFQSAGIPLLVPKADDPRITRAGDKVFSMSYDAVEQGRRIAAWLRVVEGAERIAVVHADDQASKDLLRAVGKNTGPDMAIARTVELSGGMVGADFVQKHFPELLKRRGGDDRDGRDGRGGEGRDDRGGKGGKGGKGRKGRGGRGKGQGAQGRRDGGADGDDDEEAGEGFDAIVVLAGAEAGVAIVQALQKARVDLPVVGTSAWDDDGFVAGVGKGRGVYLTTAFSWEIVTEETRDLVAALGEQPPVEALFAYDALELIGAAVAANGAAEAVDAAMVAADLARRNTPDQAVAGMTGLLWFDDNGALMREPLVQQVRKGRLMPSFTQLTRVVEPRTAKAALRGGDSKFLGDRKVEVVDGVPYYLTSVVYAGLDFYRVNSVDVQGQNFDVEFFMWFQWRGDLDVENIDFLNGIYGIEDKVEVLREDRSGPVNYICYKIKGTYLTPYDLRAFPFDVQHLPLRMAHKTRDANEVILVVDQERITDAPIEEIYPEEWVHKGRTDHSAAYEPDTTFGDPMFSGPASRSTYSVYESNIVVKRILFPYLVTLFMPLGIMIVISLFVFFVPRSQFDARMTITMTALLSILVFHLAQGESLPSVGYLMRADQFFMATYLLMFALIAKTILVNALNEKVEDKYLVWAERIFTVLFVPVCLFIYVVLVLWPT